MQREALHFNVGDYPLCENKEVPKTDCLKGLAPMNQVLNLGLVIPVFGLVAIAIAFASSTH